MNKNTKKFTIIFSIITLFFGLSLINTKVYAKSTDPIVMTFETNKVSDEVFKIDVKLVKNSGILAMNLDLIYDNSAMSLIDLQFNEALESLNPISTNPNTELGYSIYPFKISYEGENNDYTVGSLMTFTFSLNEGISDASYNIKLGYDKNGAITMLEDGKIITKNLIVDNVNIIVKGNITDSFSINSEGKDNNYIYIVIIIVSIIVVLALLILGFILYKKKNKDKKWVKIQ